MKTLPIIVLLLACFSVHAQKWGHEFGSNYLYVKPGGQMGQVIHRGHGVAMNYGLVKPDNRFAFGIDMCFAEYGRDKSRQEYEMEDGSLAPMDIIVSNSFLNIMLYSRWYLATKGAVRPYMVGKFGFSSFSTDLNIYDPDDFDHCEPVETDVLYNDGTWVAAAGAGVKVDFAAVFKKLPQGLLSLETNINFTQGGNVHYMSEDANSNHQHRTPESDHVYAQFLNTDTQIIHEHHVGHLYKSAVQMTELRVGVSMSLSRQRP